MQRLIAMVFSVKEKLSIVPELGQGGATEPARDEIWGNQKTACLAATQEFHHKYLC